MRRLFLSFADWPGFPAYKILFRAQKAVVVFVVVALYADGIETLYSKRLNDEFFYERELKMRRGICHEVVL